MTVSTNSSSAYLMYSVFKAEVPLPDADERAEMARSVNQEIENIDGLNLRGWYDVSGYRADADLMGWWWGPTAESVQQAYQTFRASDLGWFFAPVWSQVGAHRPAEFNPDHVPAFLEGKDPKGYLCVYPFVRSYDWYILPDEERSTMLRDHGLAARDFTDVLPNTVASFGLGDYEWLLGFEADDVARIVDLMRALRATQARLHVREEVPFYTGPRGDLDQIVARLP
ncbi:MAG TPA: hydrogen peroxide-dependent heme synthase [Beutenbergiaceae bacterium]|nr:hydrogen peroxide-dependent heme synthase [Beutenbergiaceae bacterium]